MHTKQEEPILSIIIPVFNTEKYIARCLDSLINQSLKKIEIIIVDDLSTDNSALIISEYVQKYKFIKYYMMTAKGSAGGARNLGIMHAKSKYIGFVDSDDWVDTMMFEKMVNAAETCNADVAMCGVIYEFGSVHESVKRHEYIFENIIEGRAAFDLLTRYYNQDMVISPIVCNKIYKTKFLQDNQFTFLANNYNDDDIFNFICLLSITKLIIVPYTYYHYYQRPNSIMHRFSTKHMDDLVVGFTALREYLEKHNFFEAVKENYYSYLELNLATIINILAASEYDPAKQMKYIDYLIHKIINSIVLREYIEYVGLKRIIRFLVPSFKR